MTSGAGPSFTLRLVGPLRLIRSDGVDVTPVSAKAQGMLALLGTSSGHRRSRAWLQDKLWSDRDQEHGAASLRQALTGMRQALGEDRSCILTEQNWVALNPAQVTVLLEPTPEDWDLAGEPPEFCEGLDIADPEFEDWIRDQRAATEERLAALERPAPPRPAPFRTAPDPAEGTVLLVAPALVDSEALLAQADMLSTHIAAQVARMGGIDVKFERPGAPAPTEALRLQMRACRFGERSMLQAQLTDAQHGTLLWTASRDLPMAAFERDSSEIAAFVAEVAAASTLQLGRGGPGEPGSRIRASYRALRDVLSYDGATLAQCDRTLASWPETPGEAARRAWRAHLRVISIVERLATNTGDTRAEAIELARHALEADPINPIVNALAADVALLIEGRPMKAFQLARAAVEQDRFSPFTHASLAQALASLGEAERAHTEACTALSLSSGQPNLSWWHMRCAMTATRCGRFEEAARYAQAAHELSPNFRPPLRYLAALRYHLRDEKGAAEALQALKLLEPDFTLELMASESYPVASLRGPLLLDVVRSELV